MYNLTFSPPRLAGICDSCNGVLVQRDDDREETIKERLVQYRKQTEPLIMYYEEQSILHTIIGEGDINDIYGRIESVLTQI